MRLFRIFFLINFLSLNFSFPAFSAEKQDISIRTELSNTALTIGDRVEYRIVIEHGPDVTVLDIDLRDTFRDFEVKEKEILSEERQGGTVIDGKRVIFTSFLIGEYVLLPAKISYKNASGDVFEALSNKLYISVESIHQESGEEVTDIRGVKGVIGFRGASWLLLILVFLLVLAGAGFIMWRKRHHAPVTAKDVELPLSPHEEAKRSLARLIDSDLLKHNLYKSYFSQMSEILRRYFERRYNFLALEYTTAEVMHHIRKLDLDGKTRTMIRKLLESCDLVKFAKHKPAPNEVFQYNQEAKQIIELTAPQPPARTTIEPPKSSLKRTSYVCL